MTVLRLISGSMILIAMHFTGHAQTMVGDTLPVFTIRGSTDGVKELFLIDSIRIEKSPAQKDVARLLSNRTAVYVKDYGVGNIATISMRGGAAAQSRVNWNGIPMNSPTLGVADLSLLPTALITDIDIHHGAGSSLGASGALGGGIDIRSAPRGLPGLELSAYYTPLLSSHSKSVIWRSRSRDGRLHSRTAVVRSHAENAFDYQRTTSNGMLTERRKNAASAMTALGHSAQMAHLQAVSEWNVDYLQSDRQIPAPVGTSFRGESQYDRALRLRYKLSTTRSGITLAHLNDRQHYEDPLSGVHSQIATERIHAQVGHTFLDNDRRRYGMRVEADEISARVSSSYSHRRSIQALAAEIREHLGPSVDVDMELRTQLTDAEPDPLMGALGLRIRPLTDGRSVIHAIISRSYRLPSFNDYYWPGAGDTTLEPEQGWTIEGGLEWTGEGRGWSLTYYRNELDRLIAWVPNAAGRWRPENVDDVVSQGLEVSAHWGTEVVSCKAKYRYDRSVEHARPGDIGQGRQRLYSPQHVAIVTARATQGHRLSPYVNGRYVSGVYVDGISDRRVGAHVVLDCGASCSLDEDQRVSFDLRLNNLIGKNYEVVVGRPQPGRHIQFILTYTLPAK